MKEQIYKKIGEIIKKFLLYAGDDRPYQSFLYDGQYIEGKINTVQMYYSFDIVSEIKGKSLLDLGCNEGSICLMAAQDGASPIVGVERRENYYKKALKRLQETKFKVEYVQDDILNYIESAEQYDVITLLALARHIHKALMIKNGCDILSTGRSHGGYLTYNPFETLILGKNNPVKEEFDNFMKMYIDKSRMYFICSIHDLSGLIFRRQEQTKQYFRKLSAKVKDIEIFQFSPVTSEYVVIRLKLYT